MQQNHVRSIKSSKAKPWFKLSKCYHAVPSLQDSVFTISLPLWCGLRRSHDFKLLCWTFTLHPQVLPWLLLSLVVAAGGCRGGARLLLLLAALVQEAVVGRFQVFDFHLIIIHPHGSQSTGHLLLKPSKQCNEAPEAASARPPHPTAWRGGAQGASEPPGNESWALQQEQELPSMGAQSAELFTPHFTQEHTAPRSAALNSTLSPCPALLPGWLCTPTL